MITRTLNYYPQLQNLLKDNNDFKEEITRLKAELERERELRKELVDELTKCI